MQVNLNERSRYVNTPAPEVAAIWRKHNLVINVVSGIAILVLALSFLARSNPSLLAFIGTLVGFAAIVLAQWAFKFRETNEVLKVVTHDCDPAKLAQTIDIMLANMRDKRSRQMFSSNYALCSALMGYDDVALAWVSQVEQQAPKNKLLRLSLINTRIAVAAHHADASALANLRGQVLAIEGESRQGTPLEKNANTLLCSIDRHLAFIAKDYERVRELNGSLEALATTPQAVVAYAYNKGELEDALGNVAAAWPHFAFVANQGGTTLVHAKAVEWLGAHDPRNAAPAVTSGEEAADADQAR